VVTPKARPVELSVVTPLFNCLDHTRAMLGSLLESLPASLPFEVILVDDGSTDGTRPWLATLSDARVRVFLNEKNIGFAGACNRGAAQARGRVLAFLNNDLVLSPGWFRPMLRCLNALGTRAGIVGNVQHSARTGEVDHAGIRFDLKGKPEHIRRAPSPLGALLFPLREVPAVTGACFIVHADTWRRLGGFDTSYVNGCEDVDLCLRARQEGLINAVALRSHVLHHVSASPGRKLRDEENTLRLVTRWRDAIAEESSRLWARELIAPVLPDPRKAADPAEAWDTALHALGLPTTPSRTALAAAHRAIDSELARWNQLLAG
jgi:O-antigen biosynthesis protein